jgi:hypothetical protein
MKKHLQKGFILGMILLTTNTYGQTENVETEKINADKKAETYFDILINVVNTNINYGKENSVFTDYKKSARGIQAGVSFQAGITPNFSLASELYFIMKGGTLKANNPLTTSKSTLHLNTLELPLLARFHFGKFYVNAGPSIAYNLGGTNKIESTSKAISFTNSSEGFKRLDAGIQMGAGYRFKVRRKSVALDVRYSYGLTDISYGQEMYNRYANISLRISNPWKRNPLVKNRIVK